MGLPRKELENKFNEAYKEWHELRIDPEHHACDLLKLYYKMDMALYALSDYDRLEEQEK